MATNWHHLTTEKIRQITPYQPGKPIKELQRELGIKDVIKLASNENPLGPSPKALEAAIHPLGHLAQYPDGSSHDLKHALATAFSVTPQQLTLGNGSDEIFRLILQAFAQNTSTTPNEVICSKYAFAAFPIAALSFGCNIKQASCNDFTLDVNSILPLITAQTRVIYIDNPNNPLGTAISHQDLEFLLQNIPSSVLVLLDEAYIEYVDWVDYPKSISLLSMYENLIVTRTFSKAYGLAGLRVGFSMSNTDIADILNRIRLPFNNNAVAQAAARAALDDHEHLDRSITLVHKEKKVLEQEFRALDLNFIQSYANFIAVDVNHSALAIYEQLLHSGIIVRPILGYTLDTYLRISIGLPGENQRLLGELTRIIEGL